MPTDNDWLLEGKCSDSRIIFGFQPARDRDGTARVIYFGVATGYSYHYRLYQTEDRIRSEPHKARVIRVKPYPFACFRQELARRGLAVDHVRLRRPTEVRTLSR
jgi:hypothetical protein